MLFITATMCSIIIAEEFSRDASCVDLVGDNLRFFSCSGCRGWPVKQLHVLSEQLSASGRARRKSMHSWIHFAACSTAESSAAALHLRAKVGAFHQTESAQGRGTHLRWLARATAFMQPMMTAARVSGVCLRHS